MTNLQIIQRRSQILYIVLINVLLIKTFFPKKDPKLKVKQMQILRLCRRFHYKRKYLLSLLVYCPILFRVLTNSHSTSPCNDCVLF